MNELKEIYNDTLQMLSQEEREVFRDMAQKTFNLLREETRDRIKGFEERILASESKSNKVVEIVSVLIPKESKYLYEDKFSPMVIKPEESTGKFLSSNENLEYTNIFLEVPDSELSRYTNTKIDGKIITDKDEYNVKFKLVNDSRDCEEAVKNLYDVFCLNNTKWRTCNIPYMHKSFKVVLDEYPQELEAQIQTGIQATEVILEPGNLSSIWLENYELLWNIRQINVIGKGDIRPTENRIHGEYVFYFETPENMYICPDDEKHIYYVSQFEREIQIVTDEFTERRWKFYKIDEIDTRIFSQEEKPFFSNKMNANLLNNLKEQSLTRIRNTGELKRIIYSFKDIADNLEFNRVEIIESADMGDKSNDKDKSSNDSANYSPNNVEDKNINKNINKNLNKFVEDEFSLKGRKSYLYLYFTLKKNSIFTKELLDFIVSEIQLYFSEYECRGVIR